MNTRSLDELLDPTPGFVLDTLTLEERADLERGLRDPSLAPRLQEEIDAMREALGHVGASTPVAPPPALRERVLARVAAEAAVGPSVSAATDAPVAPVSAPAAPRDATRVATTVPARRTWVPAVFALAAAASVVVALGLRRDRDALQATLAAQQATHAATLDSLRAALARRDATIRTLADAGNSLQLVRLAPNTVDGPSMQVYWNVKRGAAVIVAAGLAPIAADRAYCLWIIRDGKPAAVALFRPDSTGAQVLPDVAVPTSVAGVAAFAVTEEPAAGSPQPTMTPFLVGSVGTR